MDSGITSLLQSDSIIVPTNLLLLYIMGNLLCRSNMDRDLMWCISPHACYQRKQPRNLWMCHRHWLLVDQTGCHRFPRLVNCTFLIKLALLSNMMLCSSKQNLPVKVELQPNPKSFTLERSILWLVSVQTMDQPSSKVVNLPIPLKS